MHLKKVGFTLWLLFFFSTSFSQVINADSLTITKYGFENELAVSSRLTFFIDPGKSIDFPQILNKKFNTPGAVFIKQFNTSPQKNFYWVRFSIQNNSDSVLHPLLDCGAVSYLKLYLVSNNHLQQEARGGNLQDLNKSISQEEQTYSILRLVLAPHQSGVVYIKMIQETDASYFNGIGIYKKHVLYNSLESFYYHNKDDLIWGILLQGFVLFQILYIIFQWFIIRRREYLYYFFYLIAILLYLLSKQEGMYGEIFLFYAIRYGAFILIKHYK